MVNISRFCLKSAQADRKINIRKTRVQHTKLLEVFMNNQNEKANRSCSEQDIVFDIKYFMQDFYFADFISNGNELKLLLNNGQCFTILVKECL